MTKRAVARFGSKPAPEAILLLQIVQHPRDPLIKKKRRTVAALGAVLICKRSSLRP
jgi:hypothetical protein